VCPYVRGFVVWQTDGWTPLCVASQEGQVEVVMALVGAGAAVNQATVREDWGGCWCYGVGGWLVFGSQHARAVLCAWCVWLWGVHGVRGCGAHAELRVVWRPYILSRTC
jgi:hypothetical protein